MNSLFYALLLVTSFYVHAETKPCSWCVSDDLKITEDILKLSQLNEKEQLKKIRDQQIAIIVLKSHTKVLPGTFSWGKHIRPHGDLTSISSQKDLMGKTLCKGEHMYSDWQDTIALSDVAPRSTLIHEYIHILQLRRDEKWCPLSKKLWASTSPSKEETQAQRNKEWDAHKLLWKLHKELAYDLDDEIAISSETLEEAKARKDWDAQAIDWIKKEGVEAFMNKKIEEYMILRVHIKKKSK